MFTTGCCILCLTLRKPIKDALGYLIYKNIPMIIGGKNV